MVTAVHSHDMNPLLRHHDYCSTTRHCEEQSDEAIQISGLLRFAQRFYVDDVDAFRYVRG